MNENWTRINEVFQDLFEDDSLEVTRETTAKDVEGWDSLMHVRLMIKMEKAFNIKFTSSEVATFKNVGEMIDSIEAKTAR